MFGLNCEIPRLFRLMRRCAPRVDPCGYHYYYDYENRLAKITDPCDACEVAAYDYHALGRRIECECKRK